MRHNITIIAHPVGLTFFNFFWLANTLKLHYTLRVWFLWFVGSKSFWSWVGMNIDLDLNEVSVAFCAGCSFFPTFSFTFWKSCSLSFLFLLFFAMLENRALSTDEDKFYQTKNRERSWKLLTHMLVRQQITRQRIISRRKRTSRPSNLTVWKESLLHVSCTAKGEAGTKMDERILSRLRIKVLVL